MVYIKMQLLQNGICECLFKIVWNTIEIDAENRTYKKHARVAQWLEHWSSKPGVDSSILSSGIDFPFFLFLFVPEKGYYLHETDIFDTL